MRAPALLGVAALATASLIAAEALACLWDDERQYGSTLDAKPCVYDAVAGASFPHDESYHAARLAAAETALRWAPRWVDGLDIEAVALIRLGRLDDAREVLAARLAVDGQDYGAHANLAALHLLAGERDRAAQHADQAAAIAPERRAAVAKLFARLASFAKAPKEGASLFGLELDEAARLRGSRKRFAEAKADPAWFDGLVAMVAECGLDRHPQVYFALGDLLGLRGDRKAAFLAYSEAAKLGYDDQPLVKGLIKKLQALMPDRQSSDYPIPGEWKQALGKRELAQLLTRKFQQWERYRITHDGEPAWGRTAYAAAARKRHQLRGRCAAPVIDGKRAKPPKKEPSQ